MCSPVRVGSEGKIVDAVDVGRKGTLISSTALGAVKGYIAKE